MMRRQRRNNPKKTGFILAVIAILIVSVAAIIERQASVFEMVILWLFLFIPILYNAYSGMDQGAAYIIGLLLGAVSVGIFFGALFLFDNNPLIKNILTWPMPPV